jgi:hypothetical protein
MSDVVMSMVSSCTVPCEPLLCMGLGHVFLSLLELKE